MKKVTLELGGTMYTIYFEVSHFVNGYTILIKRITSMTDNCMSIIGFNLNDIQRKVMLSPKMWSDV